VTLTLLAALAVLTGPATPPAPGATAPRAAATARPTTGPDAAAGPAAAPEATKVHVDGIDEGHYVPRRHEATFTGHPVVLTREDAKLRCNRLVALFDDRNEISTATCTGDVRFVRGERTVTCKVAVFDNGAGKVTCDGEPVVITEPGSEAQGSRLVYDLATDEVTLFDAKASISGGTIDERQKQYEQRKKERK
jgi:hypothetical protein